MVVIYFGRLVIGSVVVNGRPLPQVNFRSPAGPSIFTPDFGKRGERKKVVSLSLKKFLQHFVEMIIDGKLNFDQIIK